MKKIKCISCDKLMEINPSIEIESDYYVEIKHNNKIIGYFCLDCWNNEDDNVIDQKILELTG